MREIKFQLTKNIDLGSDIWLCDIQKTKECSSEEKDIYGVNYKKSGEYFRCLLIEHPVGDGDNLIYEIKIVANGFDYSLEYSFFSNKENAEIALEKEMRELLNKTEE